MRDDYYELSLAKVHDERDSLEDVKNGPFMISLEKIYENSSDVLLVLQFLPVPDLTKMLKVRRFSESELKFYSAEIIVGIEYIHNLGIIHRDIKPENIGLDKEGHICIIDFGLSKRADIEGGRRKFAAFFGTYEYTAPEIRRNSEYYDASIDW